MRKICLVTLLVVFAASMMVAQTVLQNVDVLGAHQNNGRGCAGCHTPHSGARGSGQATTDATSGNIALWGQDVQVLYGKTFSFGDKAPSYAPGRWDVTLPTSMAGGISDAETAGILMCLSCHDGSVTPQNMMQKQSYEQLAGLLPAAYGSTPIPTLLGKDGTADTAYGANYYNDHPIGKTAVIETGEGLYFDETIVNYAPKGLSVTAGSDYEKFVNNYGWPSLAPGRWSKPYGVVATTTTDAGGNTTTTHEAFVVCTTCHDQHLMTVYTSTDGSAYGSQIAQDGGNKHYQTYFFVRGPYNVKAQTNTTGNAASTTQFCRQCHFGESNEANGVYGVATTF